MKTKFETVMVVACACASIAVLSSLFASILIYTSGNDALAARLWDILVITGLSSAAVVLLDNVILHTFVRVVVIPRKAPRITVIPHEDTER